MKKRLLIVIAITIGIVFVPWILGDITLLIIPQDHKMGLFQQWMYGFVSTVMAGGIIGMAAVIVWAIGIFIMCVFLMISNFIDRVVFYIKYGYWN